VVRSTRTLEPALADVRALVYRTLADEGRPPSIVELARRLGRDEGDIRGALAALHAAHLIVLAPDGDAIRMAHPFSAAPMGFVVRADDQRWWGGCTWDSFGIAAAIGREVRIETSCPQCGADIRFRGGPMHPPEPGPVARIPLQAANWWDDVVWTCTRIRTFCTYEHVVAHGAETGEAVGEIVPIEGLWRLAGSWYGDRLAVDYAPRTREAAQALLADAGFTGSFWELP
jgi:Alkylmercury lyase